jgi:pseudouridine kinase
MDPLAKLMEEKGDEIFSGADSIITEIDIDKNVLKQVFFYAEKYDIPVYAVVANMSIASKRRDLILKTSCFVCNEQEAGILFVRKFEGMGPDELRDELSELVIRAGIPAMVVTMGGQGSVYATRDGRKGYCPAHHVSVRDTTGAGDAFCAGVSVGLTYGKTMDESLEIGTRLAASVITVSENVCPRFQPAEFGLQVD